MTTTISVTSKGQLALPKRFCERKKIKPGVILRVTEVGEGLYVTLLPEPSEQELKEVIEAAGSLTRKQTVEEEAMVEEVIREVRAERRPHRR
jgi:bifunctional DNA-binding transcriptional regulator/antitoxin component of YhaV-PrlF toxin-antitoxin module